ncbi:MAG TPA: cobyric acid synthase [Kofleriaceae bacterium]
MRSERAAAVMVLGTASHVGKSVMTAALCRIFREDGIDVAPFKAQNMALNSFATRDGLEIGRAQAVQAEAARVHATADMNPVLLKPVCDTASQVVLNGRLFGTLTGKELYSQRSIFITAARDAYDRLASRHELIVLEGAGSPVEMNLKQLDYVNLAMAEYANAKCILVADIDRGGVFAQLVGTFSLLEPDERARFVGFIINRFRGDPALLGNAVEDLERRTSQRCLGVVPYLRDLAIAQEDSVVLDAPPRPANEEAGLRIGAVLLPSLSNFTDFDVLASIPGVRFEYIRDARQLLGLDVVIIPGSKSTVRDLKYLRDTGIAAGIVAHAREHRPVIGICGGFQMLGRSIDDPAAVESNERDVPGLNLLDVTTSMLRTKTTQQITGRFADADRFGAAEVVGYEIHVGVTRRGDVDPLLRLTRIGSRETIEDGAISRDGRILGTYVHGIFDEPAAAIALLDYLCGICGRTPLPTDAITTRADPYARLAAHVRQHIDVRALHEALQSESRR